MQEVFKRIIEKLEELKKSETEREDLCDEEGHGDGEEIYEDGKSQGRFEQVVRIIEIVKQEAEKYDNGWIPCSERLPDECVPVNVTWINRNPESYYAKIKDVPFSATAVYYNSKWYWYSSTCVDYLSEYGKNDFDLVDKDVDIIAWKPLPQPYTKGE